MNQLGGPCPTSYKDDLTIELRGMKSRVTGKEMPTESYKFSYDLPKPGDSKLFLIP